MKLADSRYVEVTLDEMDAFLRRAFHALRPRRNTRPGEVTYDLSLSDNHSILIRVYTSIYAGTGMGRGKGSDSIKVVMLTDKGKPLMPKSRLIQRTKNWRTAVQDRIEEYLETYESKVEYWKAKRLERNEGKPAPREDALDQAIRQSLPPPSPGERREVEEEENDAEADEVREELERSEYVPKRDERPAPAAPARPTEPFVGEYKSLPGGGFGLVILDREGRPGEEGIGKTKGGKRTKVRLLEKQKSFRDPYHGNAPAELWTFEDVNPVRRGPYRRWAEDAQGDPIVSSVIERYLGQAV